MEKTDDQNGLMCDRSQLNPPIGVMSTGKRHWEAVINLHEAARKV